MDLTSLEERIAHLTRETQDLSDVVARQEREIATLSRRVEMLMRREAEREVGGQEAPEADRPPPHW